MRRFPFYAYPSFPHSFYASPAEASFHRSHRPFTTPASSPAPSAPTSRSVINVPVFDSDPVQDSFTPAQPHVAAVNLVDPSAAATTIQSHFRGFCVRRHHPLLHLRTIAGARKQLEELQSELERPEFSAKVRASEKERLRFNESVMAIILRLDAIEGSMAEVRSQRKEATKMAIKLQDAIDAIVMQKEESADLDPPADEGDIAANKCCTASTEDSALVEQPQNFLCPESDMLQGEAYALSPNGIVDVNAALEEKHFSPEDDGVDKPTPNHANNNVLEAEDVSPHKEDSDQQGEPGLGCVVEPHIQSAKTMYNAEQDMSYLSGENAANDAPHALDEEEGENGIDALHSETQGNYLKNDAKVNRDIFVDDAQACSASMVRIPSTPQDNVILNQLSEDCRQLKSLVGKLLLQNKAQSNILCALAERLETLEHQEHRKGRHDRQKLLREKRKPSKGSKRSTKYRNWECY